MTEEREIAIDGGTLLVTEGDGGYTVTGIKGQPSRLILPEQIEGQPICRIGKKAFLGQKKLVEVTLSNSVTELEDWAFAHCAALRRIVLPAALCRVGKGVFKDCKALSLAEAGKFKDGKALSLVETGKLKDGKVLSQAEAGGEVDIPWLLAATPVQLSAEYLFTPWEAGSREWLEKWDDRFFTLLAESDEAGFTKMVLCGEEDLLANLPDYVAGRRRSKARLCFLRLLHPMGLSNAHKQELMTYLQTHAKGCESEAAWEVVLGEHGDEKEYYEVLIQSGCVQAENLKGMLADMGERHTEMKAFLMRQEEKESREDDFFSALSLD